MKIISAHWSLHPEKAQGLYLDPETGKPRSPWYDNEIKSKQMSESAVARELDISYEMSVEGIVFKEFREGHILRRPFEINPNLPVIRYLDYGRVCACLFSQKDKMGRITFFHEIVLENSGTHELGNVIQSYSANLNCPGFRDHDDPAGSYKDHRSDTTDVDIVKKYGIKPNHKASVSTNQRKKDRVSLTKMKLAERIEGKEVIQVHESCQITIDAFQSGYRYKEDYTGKTTDLIQEMHPYEDVMDCLCGTVLEEFAVINQGLSSARPKPKVNRNPYTRY